MRLNTGVGNRACLKHLSFLKKYTLSRNKKLLGLILILVVIYQHISSGTSWNRANIWLHFAVRLLFFVWIHFSEIYAALLLWETPELPLAFLSERKDNRVEKARTKTCCLSFSVWNTQLHCIQNEIVQTFCTARNSQHFCAPNLEATKLPIILFSPSSPKPQNFWFSASSGNVSQSGVCKASSWRWQVKDPLSVLPGDWVALDSPLTNCLAGAHPVPSYTNKYSDGDGG